MAAGMDNIAQAALAVCRNVTIFKCSLIKRKIYENIPYMHGTRIYKVIVIIIKKRDNKINKKNNTKIYYDGDFQR